MLEEVDAIHIRGGNALFGETTIQGSKNAVLPVMAAALLINDVCTIENCPRIQDVEHMKNLLQSLGCKVKRSNRAITVDASCLTDLALQQEATPEMLAHALTVIRRRMKEGGQLIVDVEPSVAGAQMNLKVVETGDGAKWWSAFTGFEEELQGADSVKSTFLSDMDKLFDAALSVPDIQGVALNPWNRTMMLDKHLIRIIKPEQGK